MKRIPLQVYLLFLLLISTSFIPERLDYSTARFNNVCKDLSGDVLVYYIFIDSKTTTPWTEFDIVSTIDSIGVALNWIEKQALINGISLKIKSDYYIGKEFTTINRNLPNGSVEASLTMPNLRKGTSELNKWADYVSKKAGESFFIAPKDGIPNSQTPKTTERLIAHLRDEYNVESVALLFMVNNYYRNDISFAFNTLTSDFVEYAIVSYKYPAEIAHNLFHLYGAPDLYKTPLRKSERKVKLAESLFQNDIMQDPYSKNINQLDIGDYTKYMLGWTNELDIKYVPLLTDRFQNI